LIHRYTTVQSDSEQTKRTYISAATEAHALFHICTLNPLKDILLSYALGSSPILCARAPVHGSTGVSMIILRCLRSSSCLCDVWQAALGANVVTAIQFLLQRAGENASSVLRLDTAGAQRPSKFVAGMLSGSPLPHCPIRSMSRLGGAPAKRADVDVGRRGAVGGRHPSSLMLGIL
jgi:hypothetical protein